MSKNQSLVIQVNSDGMGVTDIKLKTILIRNYFHLLDQENQLPFAVVFYASGVHFTCEGSKILEDLKSLEKKGVKIIICKTCLGHYGLIDKTAVGITATMIDIIDLQFSADKVITL